MNSVTHQFLRAVGSPFVNYNYELDTKDVSVLYHYAIKNRMPLLYLEALRKLGMLGSLQKEYDKRICKCIEADRAIYGVSKVLDRAGIDYAFFKSIKPYREATVDADILIFGSKYKEVIEAMNCAGYLPLGSGPLSATFRDRKAVIDFDIYNEVGVSHITYLDKDMLKNFVGHRKLFNGDIVRSLYPEADLLAVIAHSVIKEQMYVLSEYYTTFYHLLDMESEALNSFLSLVDKCKMRSAAQAHLGISALLHHQVHGSIPSSLTRLLKKLGMNHLELSRVQEVDLCIPYKYHPITIIKAFIEKIGEEKARRSFGSQTLNMLNPNLATSLIRNVVHHISRKTY